MLKTRVRYFIEGKDWWVVQYKLNWYRGWETVGKAMEHSGPVRGFPLLFNNFDNAVYFAKHLTLEKLRTHNMVEDQKYADLCKKVKQEWDARAALVWDSTTTGNNKSTRKGVF